MCDNNAVMTGFDIVRDLNQVVDFSAFTNAGTAKTSAVQTRIGANLDIVFDDDDSHLRNFVMNPFNRSVAKTVGTDDDAAVQNDAVS